MKENLYNVAQFTKIVNSAINEIAYPKEPEGLYVPIQYILNSDGKRLRPVLLLLSHQLFDSHYKNAIDAAIGVEMFHNFTLIHDDMMDNADLRRNNATVHVKWNSNTGILSGDAMQIMAYKQFEKLNDDVLGKVLIVFNRTALEVCEGQQYDMDFESRPTVTVEEYLKMIRLKTSVLLAASLEMGAIIGKATSNEQQLIHEIGINMGLGFQLQDDYLDVFAKKVEFGKETGGDIVQNKKTFLLISALSKASNAQKQEILNWFCKKEFDKTEKINAIKNIYLDLGIDKLCDEIIEKYFQHAHNCLLEINVSVQRKQKLMELIEVMRYRKK